MENNMRKHFQFGISLALFAIVFGIGCTKRTEEVKPEIPRDGQTTTQNPSAPQKSGTGVGVVEHISTDRKFITLDHNDIPGIMEAMAMEYSVQSPDFLKDIHEKDSVRFTLTITPESQYLVTEIHKK
jgi:Cu/Ag efflux protein CusF